VVHVAFVTTSYPLHPGQAAGHFVEAEVLERRRRGDRVIVIAPGPATASDGAAGIFRIADGGLFGPPGALLRLRDNPLRARGIVELTLRARRLLARLGPFDEVVAHWLIPSAWPIASGCAPRIEAVAHGSDVRLLAALPRPLRLHVARRFMHDGVRVRCVSEHVRSALIAATFPALHARTVVAPSPFELPPGLERQSARLQLGVDARARLVLIACRLIPDKRVATALRAVAWLPEVVVVVVGGGPLLRTLRKDYPHVRFTGELPRPEALRWLVAADVLISASRLEGAPTIIREARALGTQVVACDAGSLRLEAERDTGLWLVPESSEPPRRRGRQD
jgi:teichuronic acid biosynthesis glycosyltransferase TuaC